jgi:hypothetical protein
VFGSALIEVAVVTNAAVSAHTIYTKSAASMA